MLESSQCPLSLSLALIDREQDSSIELQHSTTNFASNLWRNHFCLTFRCDRKPCRRGGGGEPQPKKKLMRRYRPLLLPSPPPKKWGWTIEAESSRRCEDSRRCLRSIYLTSGRSDMNEMFCSPALIEHIFTVPSSSSS